MGFGFARTFAAAAALGTMGLAASGADADPFCDGLKTALAAPIGLTAYRGSEHTDDKGAKWWDSTFRIPGATDCSVSSPGVEADSLSCNFPSTKWMDQAAIKSWGASVLACLPDAKKTSKEDSVGTEIEVPMPGSRYKTVVLIVNHMLSLATEIEISRQKNP